LRDRTKEKERIKGQKERKKEGNIKRQGNSSISEYLLPRGKCNGYKYPKLFSNPVPFMLQFTHSKSLGDP
jgi:hypothetical protein